MSRRLIALCLVASVVSPALAQAPLDAARAHFRTGIARAEDGDWRSALAAFTAAYELAPRARVLFNLAGAQLRCGLLLAASTNYRRLLTGAGELTRAQRSAAEQQLARIEERIPRLRVRIDGLLPEDRVMLDQSRLYPDELDRDMWVDPGTHQLVVLRGRAQPQTRTVVIAEGERRVLLLSLP